MPLIVLKELGNLRVFSWMIESVDRIISSDIEFQRMHFVKMK